MIGDDAEIAILIWLIVSISFIVSGILVIILEHLLLKRIRKIEVFVGLKKEEPKRPTS
jgi:uncharacterized membrane protein